MKTINNPNIDIIPRDFIKAFLIECPDHKKGKYLFIKVPAINKPEPGFIEKLKNEMPFFLNFLNNRELSNKMVEHKLVTSPKLHS